MVSFWDCAQALELRPYQAEAIDALRSHIADGYRRLILQAHTGSGKTVMACEVMRSVLAKGRRCLFLASARQLVTQCSEKLSTYGINHGVIMRGVVPYHGAAVQVASIDTLRARAVDSDRMELPKADVVIADECHKSLSPGWLKLLGKYEQAVLIGLTATPIRGDGRGLGDVYQGMVQAARPSRLIAEGSLVPTRIYAPSKPDLKGVHSKGGDYVADELAERMRKTVLVGDVFEHWRKHAEERLTVVFAVNVEHSLFMRDSFRERGVPAEHLDGDTPDEERRDIFRAFKEGSVRVLSSCGVLREGWDAPWCSCGILLQPTKKLGTYLQMAGRLQRPWPGKTDAILLDHAGAVHRHGFPDDDIDWELSESVNVQERIEERRKAKKESGGIICPECWAMRAKGPKCPECGHQAMRAGKEVKHAEGDLAEVERKQRRERRKAGGDDKQAFWDECLGWAIGTNKKVGAAAHRYKQRFGVFPNHEIANVPRSVQWQLTAKEFYQQEVLRGNGG